MPHGTDVSVGIPESGVLIMAIVFLLITLLVCLQGYFLIIRPYSDRLSEMEKAVEESRKAEAIRKEFVANVSHELKTPLTSISGFIETLQDGAAEDPEIRTKFIDIIAIETSRLKTPHKRSAGIVGHREQARVRRRRVQRRRCRGEHGGDAETAGRTEEHRDTDGAGQGYDDQRVCGQVPSDDGEPDRKCHKVFRRGRTRTDKSLLRGRAQDSEREGAGNRYSSRASRPGCSRGFTVSTSPDRKRPEEQASDFP